jgi:hypothetical protein
MLAAIENAKAVYTFAEPFIEDAPNQNKTVI